MIKKESTASTIRMTVNGRPYELRFGKSPGAIPASRTLAHVLREDLGLTGAKTGCEEGACGACTVIADGKAILSCMTLAVECDGKSITTIEGLRDSDSGDLHPIQKSFVDHTAFQCGFCTPGIIMSTKALLDSKPSPKESEVKEALGGNFCRCISHYHVVEAVMSVIRKGDGDHE